MATTHQVTCIVPDGDDKDRRIDSIGGSKGAKDTDGAWCINIDTAIKGIKDGTWKFWTTTKDGKSVWVVVAKRNGREYLKTEADDLEPNNLLALPRCR